MTTTITRRDGAMGAVSFTVRESDGTTATLTGNVFGSPGPVTLSLGNGGHAYVTGPERFGDTFGHGWVKRFIERKA